MSKQIRGFTLIELMVVVAVIAIIAAIALPNFQEQARQGRRSEAMSEVGRVKLGLERWRADNPTYGVLIPPQANGVHPAPAPWTTDNYSYAFVGNQTTYTITATPRAGGKQDGDRCGNLTATQMPGKPQWTGSDCN